MKNFRLLIPFLAIVLLFASCRSHKNLPSRPMQQDDTPMVENPIVTPEPDKPYVAPDEPSYSTLQANIICKTNGMSANGQLRMIKDSVIWVSLNKIIELGRAKITPDSVLVHIKPTNEYIRIPMKELESQYGLDFATIQAIFTGSDVTNRILHTSSSDFIKVDNLALPQSIAVRSLLPQLKATGEVRLSQFILNKALSIPFQIPKSASPFNY